jgi:Ulp1 family protease
MSTLWMEKMNETGGRGFDDVKRWTNKFDVFALEKLIIPSKYMH